MLPNQDTQTFNSRTYTSPSGSLTKITVLLVGVFCDLLLWSIFIFFGMIILILENHKFFSHFLIGLIYLLTVGWRTFRSNYPVMSLGMFLSYIPASLFLIYMQSTSTPSSDFFFIIELIFLISLSRIPLLIQSPSYNATYYNIIKKFTFFIILQTCYGVALETIRPSFFESFRWPLGLSDLKPNLTYESKTNIQFFYDNKEEADRIETYLPEILATLKKSPFYTNDESLVLIEKFQMPNFEFINKNFDNTGGFFLPIKQYSYYLVEPNRSFTPELTYYSHNNRYRAVIIHELTHQLISRFYGKWFSLFFIPTWKNEGYAEYLTAQGYYSTKSELRAILYENNISDQTLEDPFSKKRKNKYDLDDYMSAFLQTRYALDVQKISEPDFMKDAYQPASARTIREWLANEE